MRVFISHAKRNRQRALRLATNIRNSGIDVWFDEWEALVGHGLADQIYDGIRASDYVLVLLTRRSVRSRWVKQELDLAKTREVEKGGTVIVPLLYEDCEIPLALKAKVFADFRRSFDHGFDKLTALFRQTRLNHRAGARQGSYSDDIGTSLASFGLLTGLIFRGASDVSEERKAFFAGYREAVQLLAGFAQRYGADERGYKWLHAMYTLMAKRRATRDIAKKVFRIWFQGSALYTASLEKALPIQLKVAFDIGTGLRQREDSGLASSWRIQLKQYKELGLSESFLRLLKSPKTSIDKLHAALTVELSGIEDFGRFRTFYQRANISQGVLCGLNFMRALIHRKSPVGAIAIAQAAEFVIVNLDDYDRSVEILNLAVGYIDAEDITSIDAALLKVVGRLIDDIRSRLDTSTIKAFYLGLALGLMVMAPPADKAEWVTTANELARDLNLTEAIRKRLRHTGARVFYESKGYDDVVELGSAIAATLQ
jgi:hypothetical protein